MVQNQFKVQRVVLARCAVRRGRPQDRKNDRKTTGFTKPLRPEFNFGKEKVKVLGGQPVENLNSGHLWSRLVIFGHLLADEPLMKRL
jgi:hypothetical protein